VAFIRKQPDRLQLIIWRMHIACWITKASNTHSEYVVKSKGVPRQAEVAQGVPGRLRSRIFLTFRHYKGGRSSAKSTGRLYPRRNPWYSLSEVESTSGHMVLSGVPRKKSPVTPLGIDPGTVRLVAQRLNHYATPGPSRTCSTHCFSTPTMVARTRLNVTLHVHYLSYFV